MPTRCIRSVLLAALAPACMWSADVQTQPNIVILLADDLGYGDVGFQGGKAKTPNLDALAARSARFTDFYAGAPNCSPTRACLLTGRSATRVGMYNWRPGKNPMALRRSEVTVAELLRDSGYRTGVFGKWHLGEILSGKSGADVPIPADHGFTHTFVTDLNAAPSHHNPQNYVRNGTAVGKTNGYSCQLIVDEALQVLDAHPRGQPFFHYLAFHEPHVPIAAPPELTAGYTGTAPGQAEYYACIENMDRAIGRYLAALDQRQLTANTLVLFASDNGPVGFGSSGGLHGRKESIYDGGIKVPAVLSWPAQIPKSLTINAPVGAVDILPTLCAAAGITPPADRTLDGINILPLLSGGECPRTTPLFWHYFNQNPGSAIRMGDWNLVAASTAFTKVSHSFEPVMMEQVRNRVFDQFELYNLREDPAQKTNVAAQKPDQVAAMQRRLLDLLDSALNEGPDWRNPVPKP